MGQTVSHQKQAAGKGLAKDDTATPEEPVCLEKSETTSPDLDEEGCRIFRSLPPCGTHPRLLFCEEEIPHLREKFLDGPFKNMLQKLLDGSVRFHKERYVLVAALPAEEREKPSRETVEKFLKEEPIFRDALFLTFMKAYMEENAELISEVQEQLIFHARLILAAEQIYEAEKPTTKPYRVFASNAFTLEHAFTFGGMPFALLYDCMHNWMTPDDIDVVRRALVVATRGRRSWGMGFPGRRIQSNWAGYHGDLYLMTAVIEGEPGCDGEVMQLFTELMQNYFDYGVYESGHTVEDTYALNLGLREGSMAMLAMARRGTNMFRHAHYAAIFRNWLPFAMHPDRSGCIYGGSSGNNIGYPTSLLMAKYMYPACPTVDFVYRLSLYHWDAPFRKLEQWQSRIPAMLFALPAHLPLTTAAHHEPAAELPLTFHCRDRGKVTLRSSWRAHALWLTLDARPDAFLVGHDSASRGAFVLASHERTWALAPEWRFCPYSTAYSLPAIDGSGQKPKAPSVHLLSVTHGADCTSAAADLSLAYSHVWSNWARPCDAVRYAGQGYTAETLAPRDFGMCARWAPDNLVEQTDVGFGGVHQWRKEVRPGACVRRSLALVRAETPYAVVADEVDCGDGAAHEYAWAMPVGLDVEAEGGGDEVVLRAKAGDGQRVGLVVRALWKDGEERGALGLETFYTEDRRRKDKDGKFVQIEMARVCVRVTAESVLFRVALFPIADGETAPDTAWEGDGVRVANGALLEFRAATDGGVRVRD